jgi:AP-2 complex subunit alpha
MDMRGLKNFIKEIREVSDNRDAEVKRVELELSKIRAKFKSSANLTPYDRKKYVCKLLFIFMLGYQVEFGHMESVQLLSGESTSEKLIGYLAMALFLHEGHELLTLTTHTVTVDLAKGDELRKCLALTALANVGGRDFAEAMAPHVQSIVLNKTMPTIVRKKALLAALRIHRKFKGIIDTQAIGATVCETILSTDISLSMAATNFTLGLLQDPDNAQYLKGALPATIRMLERVILDRASPAEFIHCGVPSPWLQGKLIRLLQEFPPPETVAEQESISGILARIVRATARTIQEAQTSVVSRHDPLLIRCNCMVSVLSEIISLVIQWNVSSRLLVDCREALGLLLNDRKDPNRRYVGLTLLTRMSFCSSFLEAGPGEANAADSTVTFATQIAKYQPIIVAVLHDADDSLRKRALDLLYAMCDAGNAAQVVGELLEYLPLADVKFREDLVLMVAILAEKFCGDITWYVDVLVAVIEQGGDVITDDIWQRLCHIAVNAPAVQTHAVDTVFRALNRSQAINEPLVRVAALLLGEFGYQIALVSGSAPMDQLNLLHAKYAIVSDATRAMLLTTFVKFYNLYDNPAVRERIKKILTGIKTSFDPELQQRACEYYTLITTVSDEVLQASLEPLPPFDMQASTMTERLRLKHRGEAKDLWLEKGQARDAAHLRQSAILRQASAKGVDPTERDTVAASAQSETSEAARRAAQTGHTDPNTAAVAAVRDGAALAARLAAAKKASAATSPQATPQPAGGDMLVPAVPLAELPKPKADDLDSLFGGPTTPSPAIATAAAAGTDLERLAFAARFSPTDAVIFESKYLQLRCRYEMRGADARATVTIANRHRATFENVTVRIQSSPSNLMVQMQPVQATTVNSGATMEALFAARCLATFETPPLITVAGVFSDDGRLSVAVPLPFYMTTFLEPYKLDDVGKYEALWANTRAGGAGSSSAKSSDLALGSNVLSETRGDALGAAEKALFRSLKFFTLKPTPTKIYAIAAHAFMPDAQTQYNPVMVTVTAAGGGGSGAASTDDDPFGFSAPAASTTSNGKVSIEVKSPDAALQAQVYRVLEALLLGRDSVPLPQQS